jgi:hypothetical protein
MLATGASASATPRVTKVTGGWNYSAVHPGNFYVGQGGSPIARLSWSKWSSGADATGRVAITQGGCYPIYTCGVRDHNLAVWLGNTIVHRGTTYYSHMQWRWGGKRYHDWKF